MNILITSVGRRTQLLTYFKEELNGQGNLVATDNSELAPALYVADKHYIVPRITDPEYINILLNICKEEKVVAIFSLIDPELSIISKHASLFENIGVKPIVSPFDVCELWLDKYKTQSFCLDNGFNYAKTYNNLNSFQDAILKRKISYPVFIKPQKGSASLNINKANNFEEANLIFNSSQEMIIQEYLAGQELGVDVYIDFVSKKVISIFIKEKIAMRAGETDKSKSIKSDKLTSIIEQLVVKAGLVGPVDIDIFEQNGEFYISEINPRFGGGYLHAYECGVNFPKFIIQNLIGNINTPTIGEYEENVYMMKHDTLTIRKQ